MKLEEVIKSSDKTILAQMHAVPEKLHPQQMHPEKFMYVPTTILLKLFKENYRTHTFKFTNELGESIKRYGQLEPILLTRNGETIVDTDGRGRFWSNFMKGADYMPTEIFYDVAPLLKLQMEIDLNVTKTKIDTEDVAYLAKDIFDGLVNEYAVLDKDGKEKIITPKAKRNALKLTAEVMCREKDTIRKYLRVANMDARVLQVNKTRRSPQSFQRLNAIAKTFPEHNKQWKFYQEMKKRERNVKKRKQEEIKLIYATNNLKKKKKLQEIGKEDTTLNNTLFYGLLSVHQLENKQDSFLLQQTEQSKSITQNPVYQTIQKTRHYAFGARQLLRKFPKLQEGLQAYTAQDKTMYEFLDDIIITIDDCMSKGSKKAQRAVEKYFMANKAETFEEAIMRKTAKQELKEPVIVKAVGEKPVFLPLEQIIIDEHQLRKYYDADAITLLAEKIASYGQVKPGLVVPVGKKDDKTIYRVVVGNSRYQACCKAKTGYFKAFIRNDLKDYETKIYQAIEDMFEQDTILERSAMLHRMYDLAEQQAKAKNESYSVDDFLIENKHIGKPAKLKRVMALLELPQVYQDMISAQLITPDGALAVNRLPEEYHMEFLFPLMTNPAYKRSLKKDVQAKQQELKLAERGMKQSRMFEADKTVSYQKFYDQLAHQLQSVIQAYKCAEQLPSQAKKLKENVAFHLSLAKTYEEIKSLQQAIR